MNFELMLQVVSFMYNIDILHTQCNDVEDYNTKQNRFYRPKFSFINDYSRTSLNIMLY